MQEAQKITPSGGLPLSINLWAAKQHFERPLLQLLQAADPFCGSLDAAELRMDSAKVSFVQCSASHILGACCLSRTQARPSKCTACTRVLTSRRLHARGVHHWTAATAAGAPAAALGQSRPGSPPRCWGTLQHPEVLSTALMRTGQGSDPAQSGSIMSQLGRPQTTTHALAV